MVIKLMTVSVGPLQAWNVGMRSNVSLLAAASPALVVLSSS